MGSRTGLTPDDGMSAKLKADDGGEFGVVLAELEPPSSYASGSYAEFTAPSPVFLAPDTSYWVVINDGLSGRSAWRIIVSYENRASSPHGWRLEDHRLRAGFGHGKVFGGNSYPVVMRVNGQAHVPADEVQLGRLRVEDQ